MTATTILTDHTDADRQGSEVQGSDALNSEVQNSGVQSSGMKLEKWGSLASFLMALSFIVAPYIYLTGKLEEATGPMTYALADFLYGPVLAASLITVFYALREQIGERAQRRMSVALLAALVAAAAFVAVASIRSANRHYHLTHPDLNLENSTTVLVVWATLVAGVIGTGWHFLGWAWLLVGSAGWTSRRLPRLLSALYVVAGVTALFVYLLSYSPIGIEGSAVALGVVVSIWQGILLWKAAT